VRFTERDRSGEDKSRVQAYEGIVIAKKGTGISESIVVRKISQVLVWKRPSLFTVPTWWI